MGLSVCAEAPAASGQHEPVQVAVFGLTGYSITSLGLLFTPPRLKEADDWFIGIQSESLSPAEIPTRFYLAAEVTHKAAAAINPQPNRVRRARALVVSAATRRFTRTGSWIRRAWGLMSSFARWNNKKKKKPSRQVDKRKMHRCLEKTDLSLQAGSASPFFGGVAGVRTGLLSVAGSRQRA